MSMGIHHPYQLDLCADDEDPSQWIIRPEWDAPHVRCFPRTFCAWPCLLRQVGTVLGSPYDCVVARLIYANSGSRHIVTLFNQRSDLISTFESNKLFNLFNIKVIINTFSIRRYDLILIKLILER